MTDLQTPPVPCLESDIEALSPRTTALLMTVRQCLIMLLGALEDYLNQPRSIQRRIR